MFDTIWTFRTKRFAVILDWDFETDPDLSWDDTGEVAAKINSGEWVNACFRVRILFDGHELAERSGYNRDLLYHIQYGRDSSFTKIENILQALGYKLRIVKIEED